MKTHHFSPQPFWFFVLAYSFLLFSCAGWKTTTTENDDAYFSRSDIEQVRQAEINQLALTSASNTPLVSESKPESTAPEAADPTPDYVNPDYRASGSSSRARSSTSPSENQGTTINNYYNSGFYSPGFYNSFYDPFPAWGMSAGAGFYSGFTTGFYSGFYWSRPSFAWYSPGFAFGWNTGWGCSPVWGCGWNNPWARPSFGWPYYAGGFYDPFWGPGIMGNPYYWNSPYYRYPYGGNWSPYYNNQGNEGPGSGRRIIRTNMPLSGVTGSPSGGVGGPRGGRSGGRGQNVEQPGDQTAPSPNPMPNPGRRAPEQPRETDEIRRRPAETSPDRAPVPVEPATPRRRGPVATLPENEPAQAPQNQDFRRREPVTSGERSFSDRNDNRQPDYFPQESQRRTSSPEDIRPRRSEPAPVFNPPPSSTTEERRMPAAPENPFRRNPEQNDFFRSAPRPSSDFGGQRSSGSPGSGSSGGGRSGSAPIGGRRR